jgi:PIN domain nuclease of toxin-antitoxin system
MANEAMPTALLLDTHVWIWLMTGEPGRLSPDALGPIEVAKDRGDVHIAAISLWEVAMLESRGRLRLSMDCLAWIRAALTAPGVDLVPLTPEVAVASAYLPGEFHGDPADRLLVATARTHDLILVTKDERILTYGSAGYVAVLAA